MNGWTSMGGNKKTSVTIRMAQKKKNIVFERNTVECGHEKIGPGAP